MLKKIIFASLLLVNGLALGAESVKKLPAPNQKDAFLSLLGKRESIRSFNATKKISDQTLSDLLWAAFGVSHEGGRRTIPTSKDNKDLIIYVVRRDGTYEYDGVKQSLKLLSSRDLFKYFESQAFVKDAQVILVYASKTQEEYARLHAGASYQNVGIYCAEHNLHNVIRRYFELDDFKKELGLKTNILISQAIGY
jgi:nitroreductase